jgi:hypothetical protein
MKSFVVFVTVFFCACHKPCLPAKYSFTGGTASVFPDKDSIQIGDTLWFATSLPLTYKYWNGGADSSVYNLSGATNVATDIHLTALIGPNQLVGAIDSFLFTPATKGSYRTHSLIPQAGKTITYAQGSNSYDFSFGIIAQKKGIYCLTIIDIYQAMKNCNKISVVVEMKNTDSHLHYLRDIYYGGGNIDQVDLTHSYCFKVY